jgi:hypothetical protein
VGTRFFSGKVAQDTYAWNAAVSAHTHMAIRRLYAIIVAERVWQHVKFLRKHTDRSVSQVLSIHGPFRILRANALFALPD